MLIGQYESKLGAKRRLAIPAKVRSALGDKLIIAKFYEGSLVMVNPVGWQKLMTRLTSNIETLTVSVRDTDRFIMGSAYEVEPDFQGRVILPQILAEYAGITKSAIFLGLGDRVEIWDKDVWSKREHEISEYAGYLVEKLAK